MVQLTRIEHKRPDGSVYHTVQGSDYKPKEGETGKSYRMENVHLSHYLSWLIQGLEYRNTFDIEVLSPHEHPCLGNTKIEIAAQDAGIEVGKVIMPEGSLMGLRVVEKTDKGWLVDAEYDDKHAYYPPSLLERKFQV